MKVLPAAAVAKGTLIGSLAASGRAHAAAGDPAERLLSAVLPHREAAAAVGRAYAATGAEAVGPHLLDSLIPAERIAASSDEELRTVLGAKRREDFREGRTVTVEGWVLSVSEARLCALAWCSQSLV